MKIAVSATIFDEFCNIFNQVSAVIDRSCLDEIARLVRVVKEHRLYKVSMFFEDSLAFFDESGVSVFPGVNAVMLSVTNTGCFLSGHLQNGTYWETDQVELKQLDLPSSSRPVPSFLSQALNEGDGVYRP